MTTERDTCEVKVDDVPVNKKPKEIAKDGSFKRQVNRFITPFGNGDDHIPVENERYRLLWSSACPWAHRS
ncbi:hypothetical protein, partial [Pseudomonas sp. 2995-1]|uniref:hypothetical protein n=1 Tax=Pseudomonas sp. 2995-1 TaxID=1712679 RepID=UPI001C46F799